MDDLALGDDPSPTRDDVTRARTHGPAAVINRLGGYRLHCYGCHLDAPLPDGMTFEARAQYADTHVCAS